MPILVELVGLSPPVAQALWLVVAVAGSYVVHPGKQVHWDGAKDGEVLLEIVGMGPATSTSAEQK